MSKRSDNFPKRNRIFKMPEQPLPRSFILEETDVAVRRSPCNYGSQQAFAKPGTVPDPFAVQIYEKMMLEMNPNNIDPHMFLGSFELEKEALAMTAHLLGAGETSLVDGYFLSGGTESINQSIWTFRNKYFAQRGLEVFKKLNIDKMLNVDEEGLIGAVDILHEHDPSFKSPVIVAPLDAHFAFPKAAGLLGFGRNSLRQYGLTHDFKTDYADLERVVTEVFEEGRDIFLNVAVVGDTQKGRIQDVGAITTLVAELANKYGRQTPPTMVDAAAQYLFAAVMRDSSAYGREMPEWDFRVPGVSAIVADPHKNQIPYNAGILLLKNFSDTTFTGVEATYLSKDMLRGVEDLPESHKLDALHNSTIPTSRGGYGAAATWAYYLSRGVEGIRKNKEMIWSVANQIADGIRCSKDYELISEPETSIVTFRLKNGTSKQNERVYKAINEGPDDHLYISRGTTLRVRTQSDVLAASTADADGYDGLYVHVMEHNTPKSADLLLRRLHEEAKDFR